MNRRRPLPLEPVEKDEFCRCSCHDRGMSHRDCPLCYFSDGNRDLNQRIAEHCARYPESQR